MKITIELNALENLAELEGELNALDTEFKTLLGQVHAGKNDSDTPFVLQFQSLIDRANKREKNSQIDYTATIENYARGRVADVIYQYTNPRKQELLERVRLLSHRIQRELPLQGGSGHIMARKHMNNADIRFDDIMRDIDKQIDSQFADIVDSERVS